MSKLANLFISDDAFPSDVSLFFGTLEANDCIMQFNKTEFTFADMAVAAGFFASKTQARKNGWHLESIPSGFGSKRCGKRTIFWFNSID